MDEHGGNIEQALKRFRLAESAVIDFSANINPLGIPYAVKRAVLRLWIARTTIRNANI